MNSDSLENNGQRLGGEWYSIYCYHSILNLWPPPCPFPKFKNCKAAASRCPMSSIPLFYVIKSWCWQFFFKRPRARCRTSVKTSQTVWGVTSALLPLDHPQSLGKSGANNRPPLITIPINIGAYWAFFELISGRMRKGISFIFPKFIKRGLWQEVCSWNIKFLARTIGNSPHCHLTATVNVIAPKPSLRR